MDIRLVQTHYSALDGDRTERNGRRERIVREGGRTTTKKERPKRIYLNKILRSYKPQQLVVGLDKGLVKAEIVNIMEVLVFDYATCEMALKK